MIPPKGTTIDLNNVEIGIEDTEKDRNMSLPTQSRKKLIVCCSGIFLCYFYYGIIQERITRVLYGEEKEMFVYPLTLAGVCTAVIKLNYSLSEHEQITFDSGVA